MFKINRPYDSSASLIETKQILTFHPPVYSNCCREDESLEIDDETKRVRQDTDWRERVVTWEMDLRVLKNEARKEGIKEGIKEGKEEGKKEGMALAQQEIAEA